MYLSRGALLAVDAGVKALEDVGGDEAGDVTAEAEDLLEHTGADEGVAAGGLEEDGFDIRGEAAVHEGHLELVLVVGDGADAAQDGGAAEGAGEVDHEPVKSGDGDVVEGGGGFAEHLGALFDGEEGIFDRVDEDGDGEVLKEERAALDQVDVAVCRRVKGSGIKGFDGHRTSKGILAAERERTGGN